MNSNTIIDGNWHVHFITLTAKTMKPKVYVELGIYKCELFNKLIPYCEQLYGIDLNQDSEKYLKSNSKTNFFHGSTLDFIQEMKLNNIKIDLLFIDADHSKEMVLKDFFLYLPFLNKNGIIFLHDSYPLDLAHTDEGYSGTCYLAIEEIKLYNKNEIELITLPFPPGITVVRKIGGYKWDE